VGSWLSRVLLAAELVAGSLSCRADEPRGRWEGGEERWFLAGRADLGTVEHVGLAAGWGRPHWMWAGAEVHGALGLDFGAAAANLRVALLGVDLWVGPRVTRAWSHVPLPGEPSHTELPKGEGLTYRTLDLFASGILPTPGGLALWEANTTRFLDPPKGQIYEEWLRAICGPPWCGVARLGWVARLRDGALHFGLGAEWAYLDGRSSRELVRLGPILAWRIWPHLTLTGAVYWPVSDPDRLGLLERVNGALVLSFYFATGDARPRFP
jgi:hypothetical protein